MTIETNNIGFTKAAMRGDNGAEIQAEVPAHGAFYFDVKIPAGPPITNRFTAAECKEAAVFFNKLADELRRRVEAI